MEENNTAVNTATTDIPAVEKTFNQAEVDTLIKERLERNKKSIFKKLGVESEDDFESLVKKSADYASLEAKSKELEQELNALKTENARASYKRCIEKANVDSELVDFVYSKLEPLKDENVDDYSSRLTEYLAQHPNYVIAKTINSSFDLSGKKPAVNANMKMNNLLRGKE